MSEDKLRFSAKEYDLQFFEYKHLPDRLQKISKPICDLAEEMYEILPACEERIVGLRKLLEAKDCFVRANITKG